LFSGQEAIDKYLVDAAQLQTEAGNACAGIKQWRQPRCSNSKFISGLLLRSKPQELKVKE